VLQVVSEMKVPVSTTSSLMQSQQPFRSQSDPRLGSVWVIRIALTQFISNPYAVTDRKEDKYKGQDVSMAEFFQGGDLLLIQCHGLERYVRDQCEIVLLFISKKCSRKWLSNLQ
jgi:hypothetical protein